MIKLLLNKIKLIFLFVYLITSIVLYLTLDYYNNQAAEKLIEENLLMTSSIQKYISEHQKPAIFKLIKEG